jgi:hypothetical protein
MFEKSYFYPVELTKFCLTFLFELALVLFLTTCQARVTAQWGCAGAVQRLCFHMLSHVISLQFFVLLFDFKACKARSCGPIVGYSDCL